MVGWEIAVQAPWFPAIPQTEPSIKWEPDSSVGFSLMLLTFLPFAVPLNTLHPVLHAHISSSLRPSNGLDFYYLGWWDIHKEMLCQQDGKHVSCSVPVFLLERSLKNNRSSGSSLPLHLYISPWGNWWGMCGATGSLMAAYYIGFLQQSHMNICACYFQWPSSGPRYHSRKLLGIRGCLWRYRQLRSTQWLPRGRGSQRSLSSKASLCTQVALIHVTVQERKFL